MNDQDDEKKIIDEDKSQSESENQSKVDENNQPEGVDNKKNDPIPDSNQNNNENNDQTQNLDTSSEKKEENEILDNQNNERSLESSQNNDQETTQQQTSETPSEKKDEDNGSSHEVIHKKDGRLHIYIRQDKYKGELKSKNWVGRLYHDGKQKISSSGTPNLEEAIPILEKWFDDVVAGKEKEKEIQEQPVKTEETSVQPETSTQIVNKEQTSQTTTLTEPKIDAPILNQSPEDEQENKKSKFAFLDNIKNIKFKKPSFLEKSSVSKPSLKTNELSKKVTSFFKSKIGKSAVKGEEIVGVEITNKEIRLAQVSTNKSNQWVLDKFYSHPVDLPDDASVLDNGEKLGAELTIALQKSKITTLNAAIAIPVTSAIIRTLTWCLYAHLMNMSENI